MKDNVFPDVDNDGAEYGVKTSSFYKFQEGDNKLRILAVSTKPLATHFFGPSTKPIICIGMSKGCKYHNENAPKDDKGQPKSPGLKYLVYIIDRAAPETIIQADFTAAIFNQLKKIKGDLPDGDYYFEGFPMPYDLNIVYAEKEVPAKKYMVMPGKNDSPVPQEILDELETKPSLDDFIEKRKAGKVGF